MLLLIIKLLYIPIKNSKINDFTSHLIYATATIYTNQEVAK